MLIFVHSSFRILILFSTIGIVLVRHICYWLTRVKNFIIGKIEANRWKSNNLESVENFQSIIKLILHNKESKSTLKIITKVEIYDLH